MVAGDQGLYRSTVMTWVETTDVESRYIKTIFAEHSSFYGMVVHQESIKVSTGKRIGMIDVTQQVKEAVARSRVKRGLASVWVCHTSASITVNENNRVLLEDIIENLTRLVPVDGEYGHRDNAHAHILSALIKPNVEIPVSEGKPGLGTFQSILLVEFDGPRERTMTVTVLGE